VVDLPTPYLAPGGIYRIGAEDDKRLSPGAEYVVYGLLFFPQHEYLLVRTHNIEDITYYPLWLPMPLFEITDNRVSSSWRLCPDMSTSVMVAPSAFIHRSDFYDRLIGGYMDDYAAEQKEWLRIKAFIDAEDRERRL